MDFLNDIFTDLNQTTLLIFGVVYGLVFTPLLFFLFIFFNNRKVARYNSMLKAKDTPMQTKWSKMKPKLDFALKDKRPILLKKNEKVDFDEEPKKTLANRSFLYVSLIFLSLVSSPALMFLGFYIPALIVPPILFYSGLLYGLNSPVKIMKQHDQMFEKMYKIVSSKIGVEDEYRNNPRAIISVTKWAVDFVTPIAIDIKVPANFSSGSQQPFMEQFNQIFGTNNAWVARSMKKDEPGWDYEKGVVHLYAVPPLPTIAPWHERYVLDESIAWSYFPVGLGAENGVPLVNPETGKKENVLGFDVAGNQPGFGASPMALVGGTTGSGKAIDLEEKITVLTKIEENDT